MYAAVSGDGKFMITVHTTKPFTQIYDVATKNVLHALDVAYNKAFFTGPSSHAFLVKTDVSYGIVDAVTNRVLAYMRRSPSDTFETAPSNDGKSILVSFLENQLDLYLWDWPNQTLLKVSTIHEKECMDDDVYAGAMSPDGKQLAINRVLSATSIVSPNHYVKKTNGGETYTRHTVDREVRVNYHVRFLHYSPDGKWLAVTHDDGTSLVDAATRKKRFTVDDCTYDSTFTEDSRQLVTWSDERVAVFDILTCKEVRNRKIRNPNVAAGGRFATAINGTRVCVFDV